MTQYFGIGDAHGIESFIPVAGNESKWFYFKLRAQANRQRHAVAYIVDINESKIKAVNEKINKRDYIGALKLLKSVRNVKFPDQFNAKKSWKMIPNPKLDPHF